MRRFILAVAVLLGIGAASHAQETSNPLKGVYGPPSSAPGKLPGVYGASPSASGALPGVYGAPNYGSAILGPVISIPGSVARGQTLPANVSSAPLPDRPGYGSAMINGHRAIIDQSNNRVVDYQK